LQNIYSPVYITTELLTTFCAIMQQKSKLMASFLYGDYQFTRKKVTRITA